MFSALSSSNVATPSSLAGPASGLHALFSFNIPTSLFPPSAIISLTDDNSTFFLARPAAFGPLLPGKGLSGQIWVGSGFGEGGLAAGIEGELGCSDIPGWGDKKQESVPRGAEQKSGKSGSGTMKEGVVLPNSRAASQPETIWQNDRGDLVVAPSSNDGTDDHLHHPLPESSVSDAGSSQNHGEYVSIKQSAHADIQSLQETAEIQGKVVLLSRGGCGFLEKVKWAQRRGAVALIVGDDTRGGSLVTMYARGDTSNVTIPALFTSHTTAHLLSSLIPGHSSANAELGQVMKSLQGLAGQANVDAPKSTPSATMIASATPTSASSAMRDQTAVGATSGGGVFCRLGSLLGLCDKSNDAVSVGDNRRPPSSGSVDSKGSTSWGRTAESRVDRSRESTDKSHHKKGKAGRKDTGRPGLEASDDLADEEFVIGVQDWRDPDLIPRSSTLPATSTSATGKDAVKTSIPESEAVASPNVLRGGSITPGSGEYQSIDKSTGKSRDANSKDSGKQLGSKPEESDSSNKGWFSSHFGWKEGEIEIEPAQDAKQSAAAVPQNAANKQQTPIAAKSSNSPTTMFTEHEGLWVTLTPTSMSTSPFFDTLLVLVVSPLLTLTVVYALLLLRSRIRRRRWRAPKSVVERLPVRTYHTISSSSSSTSTTRSCSPGAISQTSPLLGNERRPSISRAVRSRSQTISGATVDSTVPREEKPNSLQSGSTLWRRKYTGRQVECVVCLEEYIDGQSRVMRLPCGHEFHAECM